MALLGTINKQPREILPVDISYSKVLGLRVADTITPTVEPPVGMTLVSQQVSGNVLQLHVSGGTAGNVYRWTVLTDLDVGGKVTRVEDEFDVLVEEV